MSDLPAEVELSELGAATPLARGGAGRVDALALPSPEPLVVKVFHDPATVDAAVLRRFVGWRRSLSAGERGRLDRIATWPLSVVVAGGDTVGFVMRRVPEALTAVVRLPSGAHRRTRREAQYLLAPSAHARRLGIPAISSRARLELVWGLAEAVAFLHAQRIVIGDLSSRNVVWRADPARVLLVDCDSFAFGGLGAPSPTTWTVDWDDPSRPEQHAASSDVYKLGLFALRVLSRSFQARDPEAAAGALDPTGLLLLRRSLTAEPSARPTAHAWERWASGRRAAPPRTKEPLHHA